MHVYAYMYMSMYRYRYMYMYAQFAQNAMHTHFTSHVAPFASSQPEEDQVTMHATKVAPWLVLITKTLHPFRMKVRLVFLRMMT